MVEAIEGFNPCFTANRRITRKPGGLAHDAGCYATHLGRFVDAPNFLEKKGLYENKGKNHWNHIYVRKLTHYFAGLDAYGNWVVARTLLPDTACWGCAGGSKGSYNYDPQAKLQCECCQDDKKSWDFYNDAMNTMAKLFAWQIQTGEIANDLSQITCHREAHQLGYAGNHSDIWDWCQKFGETQGNYMVHFRERVQKYLDAGLIQVEWHYDSHMPTCKKRTWYSATARYMQICLNRLGYPCTVDGLFWNETLTQFTAFQKAWGLTKEGVCDAVGWATLMKALNGEQPPNPNAEEPTPMPIGTHYTGTVETKRDGKISLWKTPLKVGRVCYVLDGQTVEVTSDFIKGTLSPAKFGVYDGYVDTQYLVNRAEIK